MDELPARRPPLELRTSRLLLRPWRESDLTPFAGLNADARVMEHFPSVLTREQSDQIAARIQEGSATRGFGFWAVELPGVAAFIGFAGLSQPSFEAHFTPCVEIGWRLSAEFWGRGYATEAAEAALDAAFVHLRLDEVVSFTVPGNRRSRRVMDKLGMRHDAGDDFEHPRVPEGHPLRTHVLYRIARDEWLARRR